MIGDDVYDSPCYCWAYQVELLSLVSATDAFVGMNASQVFQHPKTGYQFDLNFSYPLFRLHGEPDTDLFCLEGQAVSGDEFLVTYQQHGLRGLVFQEFWVG